MITRRALSIAALAVSVALLAIAIVLRPAGRGAPRPTTGLRVILVGIDGLDWFLLGRYTEEEGRLPTFERLLRSSVRADVVPTRPPVPDAGWTVAGSGRDLDSDERSRLETGDDRRLFGRVPDVVLTADGSGRPALSIGWPASWPAPDSGPPIAAPYAPSAPDHELSVAPSFFIGGPEQASSPELALGIDEIVARCEDEAADAFSRDIYGGPPPEDPVWKRHMAAARWGHMADRIVLDLAGGLIAEREPDLALVYLGGLDAVEHRFLAPAMPDYFEGETAPTEYSEILPNYYRFLDQAVERILRLSDDRTLVIVASMYGAHPSADVPTISGSHSDSPPGVLIVHGPNLTGQTAPMEVVPSDLAPTILAALGATIPSDMDGRILVAALPSWLLERFPPDYGTWYASAPEVAPGMDLEEIDALAEARLQRLMAGGTR
jgi:hypothetical protein